VRCTNVKPERALPGEDPIAVDADRWCAGMPGNAWPDDFATSGTVWRRDVFDVADQWRAGRVSVVQFAGAVLAWGYGTVGYGPHRTRRVLSADPKGARLHAALQGLQDDQVSLATPLDSYERFRTTSKLKWLGPAFFTKIIYFAGYRRGRGGVQPLILDRVVAGRLPNEAGPANRFIANWWTSTWRDYIVWAAEQARRSRFSDEPDHVEMDLFSGRWRPPRKRRP
jgi:hypothetical protein